jgi:hypothetical protein
MGQTINSVPQMIAYAGDLRRQAKQTAEPDQAAKLATSAAELERNALTQVVGPTAPHIGALLDTFA